MLSPQFYRGNVPSISLIDEPVTPGPHAEFCELLEDQLVERLSLFREGSVATDQITLSHLPPEDEVSCGSVPSISLIDEPVTPAPHAEFCEPLQEQLVVVERLSPFQEGSVATDQITLSHLPPKDEVLDRMSRLHRWNCEHVRTPYELAQRGFTELDDVTDPRNALLQFMVAATPHDAILAEILDKHDEIRENMISWFEHHFIGDDYGTLIEMIDNVPDTVSPVKAEPVYIQLPDGDKTMLMQAWRVSSPNSISSINS